MTFPRAMAWLLTTAVALLSESATKQCLAQTANQASPPTQQAVSPGDVNLEHSRVYIKVGKVGLGHEHGVVGKLREGTLKLNGESSQGTLVFDMTSFDADTPAARKFVGLEGTTDESTRKQVNTNMRGQEVLSVDKFPTAQFQVTRVSPSDKPNARGAPQVVIEGNFTLQNKTRPVKILANVSDENGWKHVRGGFAILQSDFGMKPYSKMLGAVGVTDRLEIFGVLWIAP